MSKSQNGTLVQVDSNDIVSMRETFTQEEAQKILDNAGKNRTIRPVTVRAYRLAMDGDDGEWREFDRAQEVVMFDVHGKLRAGQHRFNAFVQCKTRKTISFPVVRNASEEEIANQGAGLGRTFNDQVTMFCEVTVLPNIKPNKVTAISRILVGLQDLHVTPEKTAAKAKEYEKALTALDALVTKSGRLITSAPVMAAFVHSYGMFRDTAKWEQAVIQMDLGTGLVAQSPIWRLRTLTDDNSVSRRPQELFFKSMGALKHLHLDEVCKSLTANPKHLNDW